MSQIAKLQWWHDSHPAVRGSILEPATSETIVVEATTDDGITGYGYALHWRRDHALATAALVDGLRPEVVGAPSDQPQSLWYRIERAHTRLLGLGSARFAQSAVDLALWDVHCKALGKPLSGVVGAFRGQIETYASHDLWIGYGPDTLVQNARRHRAEGFTRVKMRVGSGDGELERERVAAVREGIGPDAELMVDAAQRYDVPTAIKIGRMLDEFNVFWYEDPVYRDDLDGLRRVAAEVGVRIATGENYYTLAEFRRLFDLGVASYILIDLQHVGGITGWYKAATLAEAYDLPVTTHVFPHLGPQLMLSTPNGYLAEFQPRWNHLFGEVTKNGQMVAHPTPGIGLQPIVRPERLHGS